MYLVKAGFLNNIGRITVMGPERYTRADQQMGKRRTH